MNYNQFIRQLQDVILIECGDDLSTDEIKGFFGVEWLHCDPNTVVLNAFECYLENEYPNN